MRKTKKWKPTAWLKRQVKNAGGPDNFAKTNGIRSSVFVEWLNNKHNLYTVSIGFIAAQLGTSINQVAY